MPENKLVVLFSQKYAPGYTGISLESSHSFEYSNENLLQSSQPKKILAKFYYPKTPNILNLKKSFDHPRYLKSEVEYGAKSARAGKNKKRGEGEGN